jgi:hypothetical protein
MRARENFGTALGAFLAESVGAKVVVAFAAKARVGFRPDLRMD